MAMSRNWTIATVAGILLVLGLNLFRYEVAATAGQVVRLDRWTGKVERCVDRGTFDAPSVLSCD